MGVEAQQVEVHTSVAIVENVFYGKVKGDLDGIDRRREWAWGGRDYRLEYRIVVVELCG